MNDILVIKTKNKERKKSYLKKCASQHTPFIGSTKVTTKKHIFDEITLKIVSKYLPASNDKL